MTHGWTSAWCMAQTPPTPGSTITACCALRLWLNLALMLGQGLATLIRSTGLNLPDFVGSLLAGITLRNITPLILPRQSARNWKKCSGLALDFRHQPGHVPHHGLDGPATLGAQGVFGFVFSTLVLQVILTLFYTLWIVSLHGQRLRSGRAVCGVWRHHAGLHLHGSRPT